MQSIIQFKKLFTNNREKNKRHCPSGKFLWWRRIVELTWLPLLYFLGAKKFDLFLPPSFVWSGINLVFLYLLLLPLINPDYLDRGHRILATEKEKLQEKLVVYAPSWMGFLLSTLMQSGKI